MTQGSVGARSRRCSWGHGTYVPRAYWKLNLSWAYRELPLNSLPILHQGMQTETSSIHSMRSSAPSSFQAWFQLTRVAANLRLYKLTLEIHMGQRMDSGRRSSAHSGSTGGNSSSSQALVILLSDIDKRRPKCGAPLRRAANRVTGTDCYSGTVRDPRILLVF